MILLIVILIVVITIYIFPQEARFAGSHTMYKTRSSSEYNRSNFCAKCHPNEAGNLSTSGAHNILTTGCICHGYYPNITAGNSYDINTNHTLTKNIYCTNCHTEYNSTGDLVVNATDASGARVEVNVQNQSPHYLLNTSDPAEKDELYKQARRYFLTNLETLKTQ